MCETKVCTKCKIEKSIELFYKTSSECKECSNKRCNNYYEENKEGILSQHKEYAKRDNKTFKKRHRTYNRDYRINHKERAMLIAARMRSKTGNLEFNITEEDIVIPEFCPVLGIKIVNDNDKLLDNSPSLDRIDPTKGYVKGNVCVISGRANTIKNKGSIEEHKKIVQYMNKNLMLDSEDYSI